MVSGVGCEDESEGGLHAAAGLLRAKGARRLAAGTRYGW